mmetsp:Transcript_32656/g.76146  ORF Transcript_32656/g.76146 Transcript_32656/m.76146 type:complete len:224 (-) Transcript_32656:787-1458(-)
MLSSFFMIEPRSCGYASSISRTKSDTSTAELWLGSPMKSISTGTTDAAESGNWIAAEWIALISIARYSEFLSPSSPCVLAISFLSTCITSTMFLGTSKSVMMSRVFLRMSRLGLLSTRMISMIISCSTFGCCRLSSCSRSSTMSLMLLSDCEASSCVYEFAAARMAVADDESATSAEAHSYTTALDCELKSVRMHLMYLDFSYGLERTTFRMSSRMTSCRMSP